MGSRSPAWAPLLESSEAARAIEIAEGIADALAAPENDDHVSVARASYAGGWSGIALLFDALGRRSRAVELADRVVDHASEAPFDARLFTGHPGYAFALALLDDADDDDAEDNDVDEVLAKVVAKASPWPGAYDLIQGVCGVGTYALARARQLHGAPSSTRSTVTGVVELLDELAVDTPAGTTWFTRVETLPVQGDRATRYPDGYFDVGLAHGVAGVVTFLAGAAGEGTPGALELLSRTLPWLLAQRIEDDGGYPLLFGDGDSPEPGRIAWCYGDPSVAVALLAAGRATGDDGLVEEARRVAALAARRPVRETGVADAMLCHGSAGLAHVFNRLGAQLQDEELLDAARSWYRVTIGAHDPDKPLGGYLGYRAAKGHEPAGFVPIAGLLEGTAGIGLALVAAATAAEPSWDELLLLHPVPAGG